MRRWMCVCVVFLVGLVGVGCDAIQNYLNPPVQVSGGATPGLGAPQDIYSGPRARIAVSAMTGQATDVGRGMADMLVTELVNTNRFVVLERAIMPEIAKELELARSGMVQPGASAPVGQLSGADLLIVGNLTGFEPNAGGVSTGGFGIGRSGHGGSLGVGVNRAYVAMDLRIVDVRTSAVVATTRVSKYSTDWAIGLSGFDVDRHRGRHRYYRTSVLGGGLSIYQGQPMEKAVRACLQAAVQFICSQTPAVYYRYDQAGQPVTPGAPGVPGGPVVGPQPVQPTVVQPTPVQPTPVQPTPVQPTPVQPTPVQPTPVQPTPPSAAPKQVYVAFATVNLYEKPDANSQVLAGAAKGTALRVEKEEGSWYFVATPDNKSGWVLKAFTSATAPQP